MTNQRRDIVLEVILLAYDAGKNHNAQNIFAYVSRIMNLFPVSQSETNTIKDGIEDIISRMGSHE